MKTSPDTRIAHNYIDGQWVMPSDAHTLGGSFNPATGEQAAQFVAASVQEVDTAIACARRAFESTTWSQQPKLRSDVLRLFADRLEHNKAQVVQTLCGRRVALVDLDLGGPNLGSLLAIPAARATLSDFIARRAESLGELAIFGGLAGTLFVFAVVLWLISGMLVRWMHGAEDVKRA